MTGDQALDAHGLTVRFGGLVAVDHVTLSVAVGQIVGLIGPNGAGKTTIFNACSGLVPPSSGTVSLFGKDVTHASAPARARLGLGRTFQRMELYDRLTVRENVAMGREATVTARRPIVGALWATRAERRAIDDATERAIDRCGIRELADRRAGTLSTGQRRLVEFARTVAGGFRILLLDEPSSGLDASETAVFSDILRGTVADEGVGILLVEHDMGLVADVCEYAYVLDFGNLIEEGTVDEVVASPRVRSAYLGEDVA